MEIGRDRPKKRIGILALSLIMVMLFMQMAWAEGGINHKVKVRDYCGYDMTIKLHYGVGGNHTKTEKIKANGSVSFETGARCPYSISGEDPSHVFAMTTICSSGGYGSGGCSVNCESSDWKIVRFDGAHTADGKILCRFEKD